MTLFESMNRECKKGPVEKLLVLFFIILIAAPEPADAKVARTAKCLLEVDGLHYIGGSCKFLPIDSRGSFRIFDSQGLGLIAQVTVSEKDKGAASWNGPIGGKSPGTELGTAYRARGACWETDTSIICAWGLEEDVSLEPTPTSDPENVLYWGSRVGMYHDIIEKKGLDTANAAIKTVPSRNGAIVFCRQYSRDYSKKCITELMQEARDSGVVLGDCSKAEFTDLTGEKFRFLGENLAQKDEFGLYLGDIQANYIIKNVKSGKILDGSSASGYSVEKDIFKALCPSSISNDLDKLPE